MSAGAPKARNYLHRRVYIAQTTSHSVGRLCRIETIGFRVRQQYLRYRKDTVL
jgi:hypothetical protein